MSHTPGPWTWNGTSDLEAGAPPDSVIFCTAEYDDGHYAVLHCEAGDRSLIAAAPELLEALVLCLDELEDRFDGAPGSNNLWMACPIGAMRGAIAMAKGERP